MESTPYVLGRGSWVFVPLSLICFVPLSLFAWLAIASPNSPVRVFIGVLGFLMSLAALGYCLIQRIREPETKPELKPETEN